MIPHWKKLGFEVTVFTVSQKYREELADPWMRELVGENFRCIELRALPHRWTRKVGIGDLGIRAIPFLLPRLLAEIGRNRPDFILWPVPPWYLLTVAPVVERLTKIRYGIDYIDPWVDGAAKLDTLKQRVSQSLARVFEGWATRRASIVYAVSQGILDDLRERYGMNGIRAQAIPYGVEFDDFRFPLPARETEQREIVVRYIGALWPDGMRPLTQIFRAFGELKRQFPLKIEFFGTTYSGETAISNQTDELRDRHGLGECLVEHPRRVSYRRAVELTLGADVLILFGGMLPYYAASKLMGLIASQRPFVAFVHRESSPYELLRSLEYPYVVGYSGEEGDGPEENYPELLKAMRAVIEMRGTYRSIDCGHPLVAERSALGMTRQFAEPILEILEVKETV